MTNLILSALLILAFGFPVFSQQRPGCGINCGTERWSVKTLSDGDADAVNFTPRETTVRELRAVHRPRRRLPDDGRVARIETQVFKVRALLIGAKLEDDNDYHVVIADLRDPQETMIVEFPDAICSGVCESKQVREMERARAAFVKRFGRPPKRFTRVRERIEVDVEGVGFFDFFHGQTGVARPSGLELHPVLGFRVVDER